MDAPIAFEGLIQESLDLIDAGDYSGAEELLVRALDLHQGQSSWVHFQLGRLYGRWNKLTSSLDHLHRAIETLGNSGEAMFRMQIVQEINSVKKKQAEQRP